jgi:hypothetical protein
MLSSCFRAEKRKDASPGANIKDNFVLKKEVILGNNILVWSCPNNVF